MRAWYVNHTKLGVVVRRDTGTSVTLSTVSPKEWVTQEEQAQREGITVLDITGRKDWTLAGLRKEAESSREARTRTCPTCGCEHTATEEWACPRCGEV